jgi:hypothetical protein
VAAKNSSTVKNAELGQNQFGSPVPEKVISYELHPGPRLAFSLDHFIAAEIVGH